MPDYDRYISSLGNANAEEQEYFCAEGCGRRVDEAGEQCENCRAYDGKLLSSLISAVDRVANKAKGAA